MTNDRFEALAHAVVQAQDDARVKASRRGSVRAALLRRADAPARRRWSFVLVPAIAIAAIVLAIVWMRPGEALTFEHGPEHTHGVVGAWLAAPADRGEVLRFSDGSEIDLHASTRARVALLDADDASVVLERGSAEARIESGAARRWHVHAGPYRVEVTGTRFSFAWDPATEAFDLALHEGEVTVDGPGIDGTRRVAAGETLRVGGSALAAVRRHDASERTVASHVDVDRERAGEVDDVSASEADGQPAISDDDRSPRTASRSERSPRPPRIARQDDAPDPAPEARVDSRDAWRDLAARAQYRDALVAAQDYGLPALCESLPAEDLLQLADVARFARTPARAIDVLRAVRRRFPDTDAAAMAAFERGRIAKASASAYPEATKWFATYLREAEDGPLAREALAGLMEAQSSAGQTTAARASASRYLERYPNGPDADIARRLAAASP